MEPRPSLPRITTPNTVDSRGLASPRRAPPPSPTYSSNSNLSGLSAQGGRSRQNSFDTGSRRSFDGPPVPRKDEKRLPGLPLAGVPSSPHRGKFGPGPGLYDTKLVSSTLSQTAIPPISPTVTGSSMNKSPHLGPPSLRPTPSSSVVVLPDVTALSIAPTDGEMARSVVKETLAHSSPSSPWSLLTIHTLPIFAGSSLKSSIENLNQLCHSHIIATTQRAPLPRLVAVLTSDLCDFVASGMLTLKAKIETTDERRLVAKMAEVWSFFWTHILSYLEGVFLPFTQMRDLPSTTNTDMLPIPVRRILLSGFLGHILLPLIPALTAIISSDESTTLSPDTDQDLSRILQMNLVLGTQPRHGRSANDSTLDDRVAIAALGKAVRQRLTGQPPATSPADWTPKRASLQRGLSVTQAGKYRRKGWRASSSFGHAGPPPTSMDGIYTRQNSDFFQPESRWGRPRVDDEDEDDTPAQSLMRSRQSSFVSSSAAPSAASTLTAGTWREGQPDFGRRPTSTIDHTPTA